MAALPAYIQCIHFGKGICAYGINCIKQHGKDDERDLCTKCHTVRIAPYQITCGKCPFMPLGKDPREDPCDTQCTFGDKCMYGELCVKNHNDERSICQICHLNYIPVWADGCKQCTVWPLAYKLCYPKAKDDEKHPHPNTNSTCEFGSHCYRMHGYDDQRPVCQSCFQVRMPVIYWRGDQEMPSLYCRKCVALYKSERHSH